jgi:hypothetical protein
MIPGAFGSEITTIPPMDEVLRRHSESLRKAADKTTSPASAESAEAAWLRKLRS